MSEEKIRLSWDDLKAPAIDKRIEEDRKIEEQRKGLEAPLALGDERGSRSLFLNTMFYLAMAGLCFGFVGWGIGEVYRLETRQSDERYFRRQVREAFDDAADVQEAKSLAKERIQQRIRAGSAAWFGIIGLILGFGLGAAEGAVMHSPKKALLEGLVGLAVGLVGGLIAGYIGQAVYSAMLSAQTVDPTESYMNPARIVGWAIAGAFLGVAQGAARLVPKKTLYGLVGGVIGGAAGGLFFDPVVHMASADWISRLIGICVVGAAVGFFVGLVEAFAKDAWIRVAAGRLSGKQFIAYRNPTLMGSEVSCDVYLFRDENVAPQHAAIWRTPSGFEIEDLNSQTGTLLNGQPVRRAKLRAGDQIRVGGNLLVFEEKERRRAR
jgi:hypothetical protein